MGKINNKAFFKGKAEAPVAPATPATLASKGTSEKVNNSKSVGLSSYFLNNVKRAITTLQNMGMNNLANEIGKVGLSVNRDKFNIAFVGEFSRGKSTLVNRLMGKDILPCGTLPTTALLTRITYGKERGMTVADHNGRIVNNLPVDEASWEGLTAANFGEKEPEGVVAITYPDSWLKRTGIALIDAPGAGDLDERRAKVISHTLNAADGAFVAVSAASPLSMSEVSFIQQKLLANRVPYLALVINMLDKVPLADRDAQVEYIIKRLKGNNINISVLIGADDVELPSDRYDSIKGTKAIKKLMETWVKDTNRGRLMESWFAVQIIRILDVAEETFRQREELIEAKESDREKMIADKKNKLNELHSQWMALQNAIKERCNDCVRQYHEKVNECCGIIIERLQHEVDHQPMARTWVEKDYAYRVKTELAAASLSLDNFVTRRVASDLQWLNENLNRQFRTLVRPQSQQISTKDFFEGHVDTDVSKYEDITKSRRKATLAIAGISIGAAALLASTGQLALLGTMGVGTGANVMASKLFNKKNEKQKEEVKKLIAQEMPHIVEDAAADSEPRIRMLYNDIIAEAMKTEMRWMQAQGKLIEEKIPSGREKALADLAKDRETIARLRADFEGFID